jgi:hypothetical protein
MVSDILERLGVPRVTASTDPQAHAALLVAARRLRLSNRKVVGLLPAEAEVAVPPVMINVGLCLAHLGTEPIGLIDANMCWPAFDAQLGRVDPSITGGFVAFEIGEPDTAPTTLTVPNGHVEAGLPRSALRALLENERARRAQVLVDLSGLDVLGEHLFGIDQVDGVVIVARTKSPEYSLVVTRRLVPPEKMMGALLVG